MACADQIHNHCCIARVQDQQLKTMREQLKNAEEMLNSSGAPVQHVRSLVCTLPSSDPLVIFQFYCRDFRLYFFNATVRILIVPHFYFC